MRGKLRVSAWIGTTAIAVLLSACGSGNEYTVCGGDGCEVCDGFGCRTVSTPSQASEDSQASCNPATTTCPCGPEQPCSGGRECLSGLCMVPCRFTSQCGAKRVCVNGECVVGCDVQSPCDEGYACSEKHVCVRDPVRGGCSEQEPCAGGLACVDGVCQGRCKTNDECADDEICNAVTEACVIDPQPVSPCQKDPSVCGDRLLCVGGYCRYPCPVEGRCDLVDERIPICKDGICVSEREANPECVTQADCGAGRDCVSNVCL